MSKLPSIGGTNKRINLLSEEEDYNFTNKEKKRKDSASQNQSPLQMIEELKRRIEQQKNEIDTRNATIKGLQRNFESLSGIVKNQKAMNAGLRSQLDSLKENSDVGHKRATDFHEQLVNLKAENRIIKDEYESLKKLHSSCDDYVLTNENLKRNLGEVENRYEKLVQKYNKLEGDKILAEKEITALKGQEKEKRVLNQRIIDLEQELKKMADHNNSIQLKSQGGEDEIFKIKVEKDKLQTLLQDKTRRLLDSQRKQKNLEDEISVLRRENDSQHRELEKTRNNMESKDVLAKLKMEDQDRQRIEVKDLQKQLETLRKENFQFRADIVELKKQCSTKSQMIDTAQTEINALRKQNQTVTDRSNVQEKEYLSEIEKLTKNLHELSRRLDSTMGDNTNLNKKLLEESERTLNYNSKVGSLNQDLTEMNSKMKLYEERYARYLRELDAILPESAIILSEKEYKKMYQDSGSVMKQLKDKILVLDNDIEVRDSKLKGLEIAFKKLSEEKEGMKTYIQSLEKEVNQKSRKLSDLQREMQEFKDEEEKLSKMIGQEKDLQEQFRRMTEEERINSEKKIQQERVRSQKQIEEEREKARKISEEREKANLLLAKYQEEEQKLKALINKEQEETAKLAAEKQSEIQRLIKEKQLEIEKEKQNNKLLWTDNKKLKDMENHLRSQAQNQIKQREKEKQQELDRMKRDLESKYKRELNEMKGEGDTNSHELKKILMDKAGQMKSMTQKFEKLGGELEFYRNRNKELEGVVSRTEKKFKESMVDLERQNKSSKEVISVLDGKWKSLQTESAQTEKKLRTENRKISQQLQTLRNKLATLKIDQKMLIIQRSLQDMDTSLKTLQNTLSCNYCMQIVKDCVRVSECGHIYCKKCKAGYQPNCGQCKKKGHMLNDRMIDDSVSKADYMRILLGAVRDDLSKISMREM